MPRIGTISIVAGEIMHLDIVLMHPVAGCDRTLGKADDLTELAYRFPLRDFLGRHLVAARNARLGHGAGSAATLLDIVDRDDDIVGGIKFDDAGRFGGVLYDLHGLVILRACERLKVFDFLAACPY